jgi:hypothetical protein
MATNFQNFCRFSSRIDNTVVQGGTVERPVSFSIAGVKYDTTFSIANAANSTVYSTDLADFDYLWIESDYNVRALLTDTNSNTFSIQIRGSGVTNRYGIPFILGLDETTDASNTVNTVQIFNTSGNTCKVRVFAVT